MRKLGLFVGLTLFALAGSARAQDEAPAAAPAADPAAAPAAEPGAAPAEAPAATPAVATEAAPAPAAAETKMQVGVAFVTGLLTKYGTTNPFNGQSVSSDAAMPFGVGISFGYNVIPGLSVGIAPQFLFNIKPKDNYSGAAAKEIDLMARIAYMYHVIPNLALGLEVIPGYSIISLSDDMKGGADISSPKGFVIAGGLNALFDINDQFFANLAVGYQMGWQKTSVGGVDFDGKTKGMRLALGGGMKF
jgi:hypothetical protein